MVHNKAKKVHKKLRKNRREVDDTGCSARTTFFSDNDVARRACPCCASTEQDSQRKQKTRLFVGAVDTTRARDPRGGCGKVVELVVDDATSGFGLIEGRPGDDLHTRTSGKSN